MNEIYNFIAKTTYEKLSIYTIFCEETRDYLRFNGKKLRKKTRLMFDKLIKGEYDTSI